MSSLETILYSFLGGIIPALLWLSFWIREDSKRPEPKGRIAETFFIGMIAVLLVLPLQKWVANIYPGLGFLPFFLWATIEEVFKFGVAYITALSTRDDDEPIDSLIYMITAALGFVALENTLFILNPLLEANTPLALSTGGSRFIGASLLHVVASGIVGVSLAFAYVSRSKIKKFTYTISGLGVAVALHTAFNLFLLEDSGVSTMETFVYVWIGAVILLAAFEKVKTLRPA